jgi:hypothetical protein
MQLYHCKLTFLGVQDQSQYLLPGNLGPIHAVSREARRSDVVQMICY